MAFIRILAVAALVLANTAWSSCRPSEPSQDQYEADSSSQHQQLGELNIALNQNQHSNDDSFQERPKRSYYQWSPRNEAPEPVYQSLSVWRPSRFHIVRPYVIPVLGIAGRPPIYLPPQPLPVNIGTPPDNPYQGPTYLPPRPQPEPQPQPQPLPEPQPNVNMTFDNRYNIDGFVYPDDSTQAPPQQQVGGGQVPTRRPRPQRPTTTRPPLVHGENGNQQQQRPSSTTYLPPWMQGGQRPPATTPRPSWTPGTRPPPPARPAPQPSQDDVQRGLSNCVWAIISCCSTSGEVRYDCFEQRGCPGAFWDTNPCDSQFAKAAIQTALDYYNTKK